MAKNYGTGVSRVLDAAQTQFTNVIFQQGKPPLDAEFTLLSDIAQEARQAVLSRACPSGWLGSGIYDHDVFVTNPAWSNWFQFGQQRPGEKRAIQWAAVNGWLIPVTGTRTGAAPGAPNDDATWNRIALAPPPSSSGGGRIDFVFLEVWQARIAPNPSQLNKPASGAIYRYGNVEGGYSFLPDDLVDPSLGFETTQRVQTQYRIRVVTGLVGLQSFPDGFDPANVRGRGTSAVDTAYEFRNMRKELGDPGLWRAGDGTANELGTVDGYTYAIPLCAVFRRNSVAWDGDPGQNLNGAFNRNPILVSDPERKGWKSFTDDEGRPVVPALAADVTSTATTITLASTMNIPLPSTATAAFIKVGDEMMGYTSISSGGNVAVTRGQLGSRAEPHKAGTSVTLVSGRPDGLFADQIAKTDILDLRHVVNPGGFDYKALLDQALDQLLRGELRANWKRSGAGPQGPFVLYQDKISTSPGALGVAKLDSPDSYREVWSDASYLQPVEAVLVPFTDNGSGRPVGVTAWGRAVTAIATLASGGQFSAGDVISIPIAQFRSSVGADADQVQFPAIPSASHPVVRIRVAGGQSDLVVGNSGFTAATPTDHNSDLVITFGADFPGTSNALFVTFHLQYGCGRGLSHKADNVHGIAFLNAATGVLSRQRGIPANYIPMSAAWAPLWSKFRRSGFAGALPTTAESYVDPGSKTVVLTPFQRVGLPGQTVFRAIQSLTGLMPNTDGRWGERTDPLGLFSGSDADDGRKNMYVVLPRGLMPGWGAVYCPIRHTSDATFGDGINFGFLVPERDLSGAGEYIRNFVPLTNTARSFATFSTVNLSTLGSTQTPATYNGTFSLDGLPIAGIRRFQDGRGLGRRGLELPPFYGIARLFAVYEARDYKEHQSAYDFITRKRSGEGRATNLLRQDIDGPTFWIEIDAFGDSTFILNADALDLSRSPNTIESFEAGEYVVEANLFGFDRGAFDLDQDCRIVLARERVDALSGGGGIVQTENVALVVPAPLTNAESVAVTYSRTPYQGDAWGSQSSQQDVEQSVGPRASGVANLIGWQEVDEGNLTRPNQKVLQVVASKGFMTTLGTGRIAGDFDGANGALDFRSVGYENAAAYPPQNPVAPRPTYSYGALTSADESFALGTAYHGCTEQLPMGALFGSRDFRGEAIDAGAGAVGLLFREPSLGQLVNVMRSTSLEQSTLPVVTSSNGGLGQILVHVDGETGNMGVLTNFRTTRGGSVFVASGAFPGGEVAGAFARLEPSVTCNATLCGIAYLVRNTVTEIEPTEVSAGSELMLLIVTTAIRRHTTKTVPAFVFCGTQGSGEGFSAADLYRIAGRPLTHDGGPLTLDPSTLVLGHKVSLKPRLGG